MALNSTFNPIAPWTPVLPIGDGEVVTWNDTLQTWTNSAGVPGSGDVTASGTLALNAVALGAGTSVIKTTTTGTGVVTLIAGNATGTGALVGSNSPTFVDDFNLAAAGVKMTGAAGTLTILGLGSGADESLIIDLDAVADTIGLSSGSGADVLTWAGSLEVLTAATVTSASGGTTLLTLNAADDTPYFLEVNNATNSRFFRVYLGSDGVTQMDGDQGLKLVVDNNWNFRLTAAGNLSWDGPLAGFESAAVAIGTDAASNVSATRLGIFRSVDNAASSGNELVNVFQTYVTATDLLASNGVANIASVYRFGVDGVASIGSPTGLLTQMRYEGSGSADNEATAEYGVLTVNIGTGFTQSTGPVGRMWFKDWGLYGPIAVQPDALNGITMRVQNNYNGSPADSPSAGMWIITAPGGGIDAEHAGATSYAFDVGLGIVGTSTTAGLGFTTAIQIGGSGSPWEETESRIGTGLNIRDYATAGININNADSAAAPSIIFDTFLQGTEQASAPAAPAANGFIIYAIDTGGKTDLYAKFNTGAAQRLAIQP